MPHDGPHGLHFGSAEQTNLEHRRTLDDPATFQIEPAQHFGDAEETALTDLEVHNRHAPIDTETARIGRKAMMQNNAVQGRQGLRKEEPPRRHVSDNTLFVVGGRGDHVDIVSQQRNQPLGPA